MKKTTLKALGINASKDIPVDDIFMPGIDAAAYGLKDEDVRHLRALRCFVNEYNAERPLRGDGKVNNATAAAELMRDTFRGLDHEEVWCLFVDNGLKPVAKALFGMGNDKAATIDIKRIARTCIETGANGLLLYHNHPSGDVKPSVADIKETEKLKKTCDVCDITFIDHVIMGDGRFYSFSEERVASIQ